MSTSDVRSDLLQTLRSMSGSRDGVSRGVFDKVYILSEAISSTLPVRFLEVLQRADEKYPAAGSDQIAVAKRLYYILETYDALPKGLVGNVGSIPGGTALIPLFELNQDDRQRVALLCQQMRSIVFGTAEFDEPHRLRLLNRIAAIEAEILKPKGVFDVVRGGINDLGETLSKFGKDIEPLTKRMQEVVGIVRRSTREYDQLPAPEDTKRLPAPSETDGPDLSGPTRK